MSEISTIYDALITRIDSLYSDPVYKRLVRPENIVENESLALNRGYGFYMLPARNTNRNLGCKLSIERPFMLVNAIALRGTERDFIIRDTGYKDLLEDQFIAINSFECNPTLTTNVSHCFFETDDSFEGVFDDQENYIVIRSRFRLEYFENIN